MKRKKTTTRGEGVRRQPKGCTTNGEQPKGCTTNGEQPEGCTTNAEQPEGSTTNGAGAESRQQELLERIAAGAQECQELERLFGQHPPPELELLLKLHRVLILKFTLEAEGAPEMIKLVKDLMRPVVDWAQVQEQRRRRELAEQKYRDEAAARKATALRPGQDEGLRPETLKQIERELKLL